MALNKCLNVCMSCSKGAGLRKCDSLGKGRGCEDHDVTRIILIFYHAYTIINLAFCCDV